MKAIPQVWADLPLKEYAEDFGDECLRVWLNPTLDLVNERVAILREWAKMAGADDAKIDELNERMFVWLSNVTQGITIAEIREAHKQSPEFMTWLNYNVTRMMDERRDQKKKVLKPR